MTLSFVGIIATVFFASALLQSLGASKILAASDRFKDRRPMLSRILHFMGEPEIVFGFYGAAFIFFLMFAEGFESGLNWMDKLNFSEVAFVFVIMILASTRPVTDLAEMVIGKISNLIPLPKKIRMYCSILVLGPLLGSLITEPAAMTISALLLKRSVYEPMRGSVSNKFFYMTLGTLFVNVSVGGALTHFAAPPVLMVARVWDWDTPYMFMNYGWKALLAVLLNVAVCVRINWKELMTMDQAEASCQSSTTYVPWWITGIHLVFITLCVTAVHHPAFVIGLFILFLGFYGITKEFQSPVKIEESMLVGFFLGGLVILTANQGWWLQPILTSIESLPLYLGTLFLAPVTDNAAITALAAQVTTLSESSKYLIVAAAVVGGGMTIIANAPNPAGFALLREHCPGKHLKPFYLVIGGGIPTLIAGTIYWIFQ